MKQRHGFVTNSSSVCYILSLADSVVRQIFEFLTEDEGALYTPEREEHDTYDFESHSFVTVPTCPAHHHTIGSMIEVGGRGTSYATCHTLPSLIDSDYLEGEPFIDFLEHWFDTLGDNILVLRESDEAEGGEFPEHVRTIVEDRALAQMEYH